MVDPIDITSQSQYNYSDGFNLTSFNDSLASLSELEALPELYQTILEILYSVTAIIAVISNVLAIVILVTKKRTSVDLRKYLINLALADISMAIFSIPFTYSDFMYGYWRFSNFLCPVTHFITICSVCVSIFTLTAIGIERYFAIVYPLKLCQCCERQTFYIIIGIWLISIMIASPMLIHARAVPFEYGNFELLDCREVWEGTVEAMTYSAIIFFVTFIIPFIALTFLYGSIGIKTLRHIQPGNDYSLRDRAQHRIKVKVVKMLLTLVSTFLICWFPIQMFNIIFWFNANLRVHNTENTAYKYFYVVSYFCCHWLSMVHTFINPFIYCYMSNNFNIEDLRMLIDKRCPKSCIGHKSEENRNVSNVTGNEMERINNKHMMHHTPASSKTFVSTSVNFNTTTVL